MTRLEFLFRKFRLIVSAQIPMHRDLFLLRRKTLHVVIFYRHIFEAGSGSDS